MKKIIMVTLTALAVLSIMAFPCFAADVIYFGCYQKNDGQLRIVKNASECRSSEVFVQWNEVGPQGPAGPTGATGPQGIPGQDGQDGAPGLSKIYSTSDNGFGELPETDFGVAPPVLKKLNLPVGKYLVTAKVMILQTSFLEPTGLFASADCTLYTGPDIFWNGPDLLDHGGYSAYVPQDYSGLSGNIPLTAVLELSEPGEVQLRCERTSDALMDWAFVQLTAINVNEIVSP
jgi:hypothetical protein